MRRCTAICLSKSFDVEAMKAHFAASCRTFSHPDVFHAEIGEGVFVFTFGVIVFWGLSAAAEQQLVADIRAYLIEPHAPPFDDTLEFDIRENETRIQADTITLPRDDVLAKLALSHGIAQSIKLFELEDYAQRAIDEVDHIPRDMVERGAIRLGRSKLTRMRGRLFLTESDINLNYALLDTPEFFWDHPELEDIYILSRRYFEIQPRIEALNRKIQIIHGMFDMLADEQQHKHASMLEWIIIWLIAFDILIFFLHDLFGIL